MKIEIEVPFLEGQEISVLNYRKRPAIWEAGKITSCEIIVREDATYRLRYTVFVHRSETSIYVNEESITPNCLTAN